MSHVRFRRLLTLAAVATLPLSLVAACGDDSKDSSAPPASAAQTVGKTTYPLTIDNCGMKVAFAKAPSRVLILNGTSVGEVESFLLLGLDQSIAANAQSYGVSDDPDMIGRIKALPTGGLTMNKNFDVPAEQVLKLKPDLVVSTWSGGFDAKQGFATREQLAAAGIASIVNPVNCAFGKPDATAAEKTAYEGQSINSSFGFLSLIGQIFDVQQRAADLVDGARKRLDAVRRKVSGQPEKKVLIAYPGMSMMNSSGLPAVMTGGIYDDVIKAAGGVNSFPGKTSDFTRTISKEQLVTAQVDVLVVGVFTPQENGDKEAERLFKAYPQWNASKTKTYVISSDGVYLGPLNAIAVEKISKAVHPGV